MIHMGRLAIFLALFVLGVASQSSNVTTCVPVYQWSINSQNQTPCLVAAFLESVCQTPSEVNSIPPNNHYLGPSAADATLCLCSTVTYSLVSACAGCQGRSFLNWTDWSANCSQVEVTTFLQPIPSQVVVPAWAYLNVTQSNNIFNPIIASLNASHSSSSSVMSSSTSSPSPSSSTAAPSPTSSVTLPTLLTTSRTQSNAGAIAGGVVGGLVALVAAGLTIFFCLRRNRKESDPIANTSSSFTASMHQRSGSGQTVGSPLSVTPYPYNERFAHDPETETFPGSPVTSAVHTTFDATSVMTPAVQIVHRYMGSAEV